MFERYTEKARRVIFFARYEASQFGSPYIESEHLLLGLLREDKALTNRFLQNRASVEAIRKQIEGHTTIREKLTTSVDLPLANDCKRILAYAAEEAERLAHKHIGTEHLLLGILREEKCIAANILKERGLRIASVREELQKHPAPGPVFIPPSARPLAPVPAPAPLVFALTGGEVLLRYQDLPLPVPRIGETIALGPPGAPARRYRVQDVTWNFVAATPEPEEIAEVRRRIGFIVARMENAIANHEFEKARFYSEEERKERDKLIDALGKLPPGVPTEPAEDLPLLREVRITLVAADESIS